MKKKRSKKRNTDTARKLSHRRKAIWTMVKIGARVIEFAVRLASFFD